MTFKTEDGVGPPPEWRLAMAQSERKRVEVLKHDGPAQEIIVESADAAYWLACLINEGLGVGEDDEDASA